MTLQTGDGSLPLARVKSRFTARAAALVSAALLLTIAFVAVAPFDRDVSTAVAAPAGDDEVIAFVVAGVGNGHGRGLSQWGSYGRAIDGQSWQQILAAYYGGTEPGNRNEDHLRVRLTGWDGVGTRRFWVSPAGWSMVMYAPDQDVQADIESAVVGALG